MLTDSLLVHLWITALAALHGFDVQIAVRDVDLVYQVRPRARA